MAFLMAVMVLASFLDTISEAPYLGSEPFTLVGSNRWA
jgi:hypothetical protein